MSNIINSVSARGVDVRDSEATLPDGACNTFSVDKKRYFKYIYPHRDNVTFATCAR